MNRSTGDIERVIQPVMEIIFFEDEKRRVSFEPERGLRVYEYTSKKIHEMQQGAEPFREYVSTKSLGLTSYGNILVLGKSETGDMRHSGHQVNSIKAASVMVMAPSRLREKGSQNS